MADYRINKRIKELIKRKGISANKFAIDLGMEQTQRIYNILGEKTGVSVDILQAILKKYKDVNARALILGGGDIESPESQSEVSLLRENIRAKDDLIVSLRAQIELLKKGRK